MANKAITALDPIDAVTTTDVVPIVDDPGGTPETKKATIAQLLAPVTSLLPSGTVVGTDDSQVLTNKEISGADNDITDLDASEITSGVVDPEYGGLGTDASDFTGVAKWAAGVASAATLVNADVASNAAIAYSKLGTGTQSVGAQQFDSTVDSKGTERTREPVNVQTTDATVTTLDSFTLASNTAVVWTVVVAAIKSDYSQAATYSRTACFRNNGGSVSQVGTTQAGITLEDDSDWDCTIDNSTTTVRCRVTGKAATTIRWTVVSQRLEVIP